jgi:hypothetical protein
MSRVCSTNWKNRNAYRVLVGKPKGMRLLRKPKRGLEYNIKVDFREME